MIRNVKRTWFEVWGTEEAQNRFLKALLLFLICLCCTLSVALTIVALRKPALIAVSASESRILTVVPPKAELLESELRRAVTGYISAHYNWEWARIDDAFRAAARYVSPDFTKKFMAANQEQIRVAREKKVSQRFYITETVIDLQAKTAQVSGDRVLMVEGLRAVNPLRVEIQFDYDDRTPENPEGIYVVAEKLISSGEGGGR